MAYPVAGGPVTSAAFTPTSAGTYRWRASYSGDANNAAVAGACNASNENVVVNQATPTIATTASPTVTLSAGTLTDVAVVGGRVNPLAGATITFTLYGPGDATCTGTEIFTSTVTYPVAGGPVTSAAFTPTSAGTYRWIASYSGDANNASVAGACDDANENVVVNKVTATIATNASPDIVLGDGSLTDDATVSGRSNPLAGAEVDFRLYGPGDATCSGTPVFESLDVAYPVAGGAVTSKRSRRRAPGRIAGSPPTAAMRTTPGRRCVRRRQRDPGRGEGDAGDRDERVAADHGRRGPAARQRERHRALKPRGGRGDRLPPLRPERCDMSGTPIFESRNVSYPVAGGPVTSAAFTPTAAGAYHVLLTLPFQERFSDLTTGQERFYLVLVVLAALVTAVVLSPVATHRQLSGRRVKDRVVKSAHTFVSIALGLLAMLVTGIVVFIFDVIIDLWTAVVVGEAVLVAPLGAHGRRPPADPGEGRHAERRSGGAVDPLGELVGLLVQRRLAAGPELVEVALELGVFIEVALEDLPHVAAPPDPTPGSARSATGRPA